MKALQGFYDATVRVRDDIQLLRKQMPAVILSDGEKEFRKYALQISSLRTLPKMQPIVDPLVRLLLEIADNVKNGTVTHADAARYADTVLSKSVKQIMTVIDSWAA